MEDLNFARDLGGAELPSPWGDVDPETRSEWALVSADEDAATDLYRLWEDAVDRSRVTIAAALADGGPGATFLDGNGNEVTVRRLLVDLVEEYGRHTGQADLIREAIDGRVGEDPPGPAWAFEL